MSWQEEWKNISRRIDGVLSLGDVAFRIFSIDNAYPDGVSDLIKKQISDIKSNLRSFIDVFGSELSIETSERINQYLNCQEINGISTSNQFSWVSPQIINISAFRSDTEYCLASNSQLILRKTERAFLHLQQCIVADEEFENKWKSVFHSKREPDLEKLGAAHLLLHGIYAFKAHSEGGRTDLVFNEPLDLSSVQRTSEGLVLTEWKKILKSGDDVNLIAKQAREQSYHYSRSALAGIELSSIRFIILVSEKRKSKPPDFNYDGVIYKHINIAVDPDSPSIDATKTNTMSS